MKRIVSILLLSVGVAAPSWAQAGVNPFTGRWDITVTTPNSTYPGWLEVMEKDGQPAARYQPRGGSVLPVRAVKLDGSHVVLTLTRPNGNRPESSWDLTASGDRLTGSLKQGEMVT